MARLEDPRFATDCEIVFDGRRVRARTGESVAAALVAAGRPLVSRSSKYHRPRGPFCLSGSCGSCLARVDGAPNRRTCRAACRAGLDVRSQNTILGAQHDLLAIVDRVYARGLDHHRLMTWNRLANRVAVKVSRQLAGLGKLPDTIAPASPAVDVERFDAIVVGAGPAGLGAAEVLAARGRRVLLLEEEAAPGGRLRANLRLEGDPPPGWPGDVAAAVERAGGEVALSACAAGLWQDGGAILGVLRAGALRLVRARCVVLATGTYPQPPDLEDGDLPGVFAARGLLAALAEHGVVPGRRAAVLGSGDEAVATARALSAAGMAATCVAGARAARGRARVEALLLAGGAEHACDTVVVAERGLPAVELARLAGARLRFDENAGRFAVVAEGATLAPGVLGAGELMAPMTAGAAAESGRRAGEAAG